MLSFLIIIRFSPAVMQRGQNTHPNSYLVDANVYMFTSDTLSLNVPLFSVHACGTFNFKC